jgi:Tol biopolymer transport system component
MVELLTSVLTNGWLVGFENELGYSLDSLSERWRQATKETFLPQLSNRDKPSETGKPLLTEGAGINLSPVISPDGKYIAFLSRQELFTLDLYLADASTGEIIKQLVSSQTDEHFDALRFMNSSGSWSPDSKKFAFTVFDEGDNAISILDIESLEVERTFQLEGILEITHLDWSPDGNKIILTGSKGDYSNLYLFNLQTNDFKQITDDRYSDIHPVWSPDGSKIAYATDRGEQTNLDQYKFGSLVIRIIDLNGKEIEVVKIGEGVKHINPQFSGDGKNIYFISNPDGISNIFRYNFDEEKFYRTTNIATGISGITKSSFAMSVSEETGQIVFNVFDDTNYKIHSLQSSEAEGTPLKPFNHDYFLAGISLPP